MIAALGATQTAEIQGGLPKELEIPMNEIVSAAVEGVDAPLIAFPTSIP
jgi:hypothetical protein